MKIIGLSGGIACGKNFVAGIFAKHGAAVFDADAQVHELFLNDKKIFAQIVDNFPKAIIDKKIDRSTLGKIVFADQKKLEKLEAIIHPQIRQKYQEFLEQVKKEKHDFILLNIPLLLEKEAYKCNKVIALVLSPSIQKRRYFKRMRQLNKNISVQEMSEKFSQIKARQLTNKQRKEKADFVINTRFAKEKTVAQVKKILKEIVD